MDNATEHSPHPSGIFATLLRVIVDFFFFWVLLFSAWAYFQPALFAGLTAHINTGLSLIMFGMGMTLGKADFLRVLKMPRAVLCGVLGQFIIMPFAALGLSIALGLPDELSMGFIILGSCPGGTASNVIAYLSRADVALSVTMTACSTLLGIILTPLLIWLLGGAYLDVEPGALLLSVLKIVLLPIMGGMCLHYALGQRLKNVQSIFPALSVAIIVLVIAAIIGANQSRLAEVALLVVGVALAHNLLGLGLGYALAWGFRLPEQARRTIAIEVGMQNSGLGVSLAATHFASAPLVALPSAIFSVLHNLSGSLLANVWSRENKKPRQAPQPDNV